MTADRLIEMVHSRMYEVDHVREDSGLVTHEEAIEATCWFIACREAEAVLDSRIKDIADLILDGELVGGPYRTVKDIERWVELWNENMMDLGWQETMPEMDTIEIARLLDIHFGIVRGE